MFELTVILKQPKQKSRIGAAKGRDSMASALAGLVPLSFLLLLVGCASRPLYPLPGKRYDASKKPLQTFRPYNLAHRGSNGEFPEETAAAYMRAIEEGADFIEGDVLASKDGVLIMQHDVTLDDTTDIAEHKEFANRKRTCNVQGTNTTGFFHFDFTLEELKSLGVKQRYPFRDQQYNGKFPIITFKEFISIALDAPRVVGIYPEIKNPAMVNQYSYWEVTSDKYLNFIKNYVMGIGPWKDTIVYVSENYLQPPTDLVARAHALNLQVHPYTYRNENQFLHFNFSQDPYKEYDYWINTIGVDGLFTDFTGSLHQYQEWTTPSPSGEKSATKLLDKIGSMISKYRNPQT
ncbi:glycerophosphodiester phosphodiesterase GDPD6-like isoform X4 [Coffea arabica]|uniref:glycerophosphodiester phosphodiesterase n=1 Tax=Coffea arabica TaxID=13443 RepID=A0A6P6X190_COFAR|nr:glycerophosphodiester phosphodiesterase GDPD6-like isoform X3 [Coffea arabica]